MIDLLFTLVLVAHLLMVNVAMSGPLYALWLERRGRRLDDRQASELGQKIAKSSWHSLVGAMLMGVAAALVIHIPGEEWFQEVAQLPHGRVHWGMAELLFSLVLLILYSGLWTRLKNRPWVHRTLALLAATNLMYHFPSFFIIFSKLRDEGRLVEAIEKSEFKQLLLDPEVVAKSLHYLLASVAMTGVVVMLMALRRFKDAEGDEEDDTDPPRRIAVIAAWVALAVSVLQLPVGFWVFVKVPVRDRDQLLGGDPLAGGLMLAGILAAVMLLHALSAVALGEEGRGKIRASAIWMLLTILFMTGVLVRLRQPGPLRETDEETRQAVPQVEAMARREVTHVNGYGEEGKTSWEWRHSASRRPQPERRPRSRPS